MQFHVLAVAVSYELFDQLSSDLKRHSITVHYALSLTSGIQLFAMQAFHLIIIDLQGVKHEHRNKLLFGLRQSKFTPILAIADNMEEKSAIDMIDCGVDLCLPSTWSPLIISTAAFSLVRRYTAYNRFDQPPSIEEAPFYCGDIYIDPLRREVKVNGKTTELRKREFTLLYYFMQNPNIVLTPEQICERIWNTAYSYTKGIGQPISELRKMIEPNPACPIYIQTVYRVGYRFTAYSSETCDK